MWQIEPHDKPQTNEKEVTTVKKKLSYGSYDISEVYKIWDWEICRVGFSFGGILSQGIDFFFFFDNPLFNKIIIIGFN